MTWLTWRQHRIEAAAALLLAVVVAASALVVIAALKPACPAPQGGYCLPNSPLGVAAQDVLSLNVVTYLLAVLPAAAGAFIAAPLTAREIEQGTHRLIWTQGVTRLRWLSTKVAWTFIPLVLISGVLGLLEMFVINGQGPHANHWDFFDQQAPMTMASTFFALSLGLAAGCLIRRSVPAMAVTFVTFVVVRVGIGELVRPHFMTPLAAQSMSSVSDATSQTAWWLNANAQTSASSLLYYQPADRFWAFQGIETGILTVLALGLLIIASAWVTRRVT